MEPVPTDKPLTDAELERLEGFLNGRQELDSAAMGLEEMDGFLSALAVGPEMIMPSEYLPEILGEAPVFSTESEGKEILDLMMRHWNSIVNDLEKDKVHVPVFTEVENDQPCGNDWAIGFMHGSSFNFEAWDKVMENEDHQFALPMMILAHEHDPDPELRPPPIPPEKRQHLLVAMGAALGMAYRHFEPQRKQAAILENDFYEDGFEDLYEDDFEDMIPAPVMRDEPKVGRNELCPCGSGKKYKRCHGGVVQ